MRQTGSVTGVAWQIFLSNARVLGGSRIVPASGIIAGLTSVSKSTARDFEGGLFCSRSFMPYPSRPVQGNGIGQLLLCLSV